MRVTLESQHAIAGGSLGHVPVEPLLWCRMDHVQAKFGMLSYDGEENM